MVVKLTTAALSKNRRFCEEAHLSFSGGGFLGIYHVGVALAFRDFAPHVADRKVLGTSAGALAASCLVSGFPVDKAINNIVKMAVHCRSLSLGPLHPRFNIFDIMREDLIAYMPADAHVRSSGKLFVSVTRASTLQNELISKFDSREELVDVLMASCFIPYFLGWVPPKIKGVSYIDGGISVNIPIYDEHTITVSPFPGESRIGPRCGNLPKVAFRPETFLRLCKTVCAPPPAILEELIQQGYNDAVYFLQKNDMIFCHSCIAADKYVPRNSNLLAAINENEQHDGDIHRLPTISDGLVISDKECVQCNERIALSDTSNVSRTLLRPLENAAIEEQLDRQMRPYRHTKLARTVTVMVAIAVLPFDCVVATVRKVANNWDVIWDCVQRGFTGLSTSLRRMLAYSQKQGCRMCGAPGAIDSKPEESTSVTAPDLPDERKLDNVDVTTDGAAVVGNESWEKKTDVTCSDCAKKCQ